MNVFNKFDRFPPVLIRVLARHRHGPPLSAEEIASKSMLPFSTVNFISRQTSWNPISIGDARAFLLGCGVDITNPVDYRRAVVYLKTRPTRPEHAFPYLRRSPEFKSIYLPLLEILNHWITR